MANWRTVYNTVSGVALSTGTVIAGDPGQPPLSAGLSVADLGVADTQPDPTSGKVWDTVAHVWNASTAHSVLSVQAFWDRWTPAERQAFNMFAIGGRTTVPPSAVNTTLPATANQLAIIEFQNYVRAASVIDCNQPYVQNTVLLCESVGSPTILAAGRAAVITA